MNQQPFILDFDKNAHAVIEPDHDQESFHFHSRLLYAFAPKEEIDLFLDKHLHRTIGMFDSVSFTPKIYEVEINGKFFTLCQAPLGAPAATQLLDWLISYGVKEVLAVGIAGALIDLPENAMLLPTRAIRDEGTSFHYMEPGQFVDLNYQFIKKVEEQLDKLDLKYDEITTWTTDGFFRETPKKVAQFRQLGASVVEMECAGMAACAHFRKINFAQLLFTADSLADTENYDVRDWGSESHSTSLYIGSQVLIQM
ncbi:nucleoside phosphorylase [Lactobacillus acidophilus]|uniref:nucleoside phosphorylase n=1 Tax=Lactobacillus acidophilus TaxID=1579 RepID=UPI001969FC32|nr:nucleoside phosphorylase [Lactobacillus acidophilus]MBN3483200.1 nucleoside phosphorylase [Lactobacillus acidophilus]UTX30848.1 nucleoside phosphorylase [Lactobacillus acidophilus]